MKVKLTFDELALIIDALERVADMVDDDIEETRGAIKEISDGIDIVGDDDSHESRDRLSATERDLIYQVKLARKYRHLIKALRSER